MTPALRARHRLTVDDFDALIASGRLAQARVELIDGELLSIDAQGPVHASLSVWLHRLLEASYGSGFYVRDHSPLRATPHDQPEPDLALVRGGEHPLAGARGRRGRRRTASLRAPTSKRPPDEVDPRLAGPASR